MRFNEITDLLPNGRPSGNGISFRCPTHDDRRASGLASPGERRWFLKCFAGCNESDILAALGLQPEDVWYEPAPQAGSVRTAGSLDALTWLADYCRVTASTINGLPVIDAPGGRLIFQFGPGMPRKLRTAGTKSFAWEGEDSLRPPLWPMPADELPSEPWFVEGESEAIVLRHLGLPAFAVTKGADTPLTPTQAADLMRRGASHAVIVFDDDEAGAKGARRLAGTLTRAGISVKVLDLAAAGLVDPLAGAKDLRDGWRAARDSDETVEAFHGRLLEARTQASVFVSDGDAPRDGTASETKSLPAFRSPMELCAAAGTAVPWLWDGWIAEGNLTLLAGREKAGKSTLLFAFMRALLDGRPFLDRPTRTKPIIMLAEEADASLAEKLRRFGLADEAERVRLLTRSGLRSRPNLTDSMAWATAEARRVGAGLIIVDTLSFFAGLSAEDENHAGAMAAALQPLLQAAGEGFAVLGLHHVAKRTGELRGSTAIAASADIIATLIREPEAPTRRRLEGTGRYQATPPSTLIELSGDMYAVLGTPEQVSAGERERTIAEMLPDALPGITVDEIVEATDIPASRASEVLRGLVSRDIVRRAGAGRRGDPYRYHLRPEAADEPESFWDERLSAA